MEEDSGVDLRWFFDQWLNRAGSPVLDGNWRYDPAAKKIIVELAQKQSGEPYRLPLEVGVSDRVEKIEMTRKDQQFEIASDKEPATVVLDPNTWILMTAKFEKH
jgi:aminopeptidase N